MKKSILLSTLLFSTALCSGQVFASDDRDEEVKGPTRASQPRYAAKKARPSSERKSDDTESESDSDDDKVKAKPRSPSSTPPSSPSPLPRDFKFEKLEKMDQPASAAAAIVQKTYPAPPIKVGDLMDILGPSFEKDRVFYSFQDIQHSVVSWTQGQRHSGGNIAFNANRRNNLATKEHADLPLFNLSRFPYLKDGLATYMYAIFPEHIGRPGAPFGHRFLLQRPVIEGELLAPEPSEEARIYSIFCYLMEKRRIAITVFEEPDYMIELYDSILKEEKTPALMSLYVRHQLAILRHYIDDPEAYEKIKDLRGRELYAMLRGVKKNVEIKIAGTLGTATMQSADHNKSKEPKEAYLNFERVMNDKNAHPQDRSFAQFNCACIEYAGIEGNPKKRGQGAMPADYKKARKNLTQVIQEGIDDKANLSKAKLSETQYSYAHFLLGNIEYSDKDAPASTRVHFQKVVDDKLLEKKLISEAQYKLGDMKYFRLGGDVDLAEAYKHYKQFLKDGVYKTGPWWTLAAHHVASLELKGFDVAQDFQSARKLYQALIDNHNTPQDIRVDAHYNLGVMNFKALIQPQPNYQEANKHFTAVLENQQHATPYILEATHYYKGLLNVDDPIAARRHFNEALKVKGLELEITAESSLMLTRMEFKGEGGEIDYAGAYQKAEVLSKNKTLPPAIITEMHYMMGLIRYKDAALINYEEAYAEFKLVELSDHSSPEQKVVSSIHLAICESDGNGCLKDEESARKRLESVINSKVAIKPEFLGLALISLAEMENRGRGGAQDFEAARHHYEQVIDNQDIPSDQKATAHYGLAFMQSLREGFEEANLIQILQRLDMITKDQTMSLANIARAEVEKVFFSYLMQDAKLRDYPAIIAQYNLVIKNLHLIPVDLERAYSEFIDVILDSKDHAEGQNLIKTIEADGRLKKEQKAQLTSKLQEAFNLHKSAVPQVQPYDYTAYNPLPAASADPMDPDADLKNKAKAELEEIAQNPRFLETRRSAAHLQLAICNYLGDGCLPNNVDALSHLEIIIGNKLYLDPKKLPLAHMQYGLMHYLGNGVPRNHNVARQHFAKVVKDKNSDPREVKKAAAMFVDSVAYAPEIKEDGENILEDRLAIFKIVADDKECTTECRAHANILLAWEEYTSKDPNKDYFKIRKRIFDVTSQDPNIVPNLQARVSLLSAHMELKGQGANRDYEKARRIVSFLKDEPNSFPEDRASALKLFNYMDQRKLGLETIQLTPHPNLQKKAAKVEPAPALEQKAGEAKPAPAAVDPKSKVPLEDPEFVNEVTTIVDGKDYTIKKFKQCERVIKNKSSSPVERSEALFSLGKILLKGIPFNKIDQVGLNPDYMQAYLYLAECMKINRLAPAKLALVNYLLAVIEYGRLQPDYIAAHSRLQNLIKTNAAIVPAQVISMAHYMLGIMGYKETAREQNPANVQMHFKKVLDDKLLSKANLDSMAVMLICYELSQGMKLTSDALTRCQSIANDQGSNGDNRVRANAVLGSVNYIGANGTIDQVSAYKHFKKALSESEFLYPGDIAQTNCYLGILTYVGPKELLKIKESRGYLEQAMVNIALLTPALQKELRYYLALQQFYGEGGPEDYINAYENAQAVLKLDGLGNKILTSLRYIIAFIEDTGLHGRKADKENAASLYNLVLEDPSEDPQTASYRAESRIALADIEYSKPVKNYPLIRKLTIDALASKAEIANQNKSKANYLLGLLEYKALGGPFAYESAIVHFKYVMSDMSPKSSSLRHYATIYYYEMMAMGYGFDKPDPDRAVSLLIALLFDKSISQAVRKDANDMLAKIKSLASPNLQIDIPSDKNIRIVANDPEENSVQAQTQIDLWWGHFNSDEPNKDYYAIYSSLLKKIEVEGVVPVKLARATLLLGIMEYEGKGCLANPISARKRFQNVATNKSASQEDKDKARSLFGDMVKKGEGVAPAPAVSSEAAVPASVTGGAAQAPENKEAKLDRLTATLLQVQAYLKPTPKKEEATDQDFIAQLVKAVKSPVTDMHHTPALNMMQNELAIEAIFAGDQHAIALVRKKLERFKIKESIDDQADALFEMGEIAYPGVAGGADPMKISDLRYQAAVAFYSQSIALNPSYNITHYGGNRLQLAKIKIDIRNDLRDYDGAKKLLQEIIDRKYDGKQLCLPGHISTTQYMLASIEKEQAVAANRSAKMGASSTDQDHFEQLGKADLKIVIPSGEDLRAVANDPEENPVQAQTQIDLMWGLFNQNWPSADYASIQECLIKSMTVKGISPDKQARATLLLGIMEYEGKGCLANPISARKRFQNVATNKSASQEDKDKAKSLFGDMVAKREGIAPAPAVSSGAAVPASVTGGAAQAPENKEAELERLKAAIQSQLKAKTSQKASKKAKLGEETTDQKHIEQLLNAVKSPVTGIHYTTTLNMMQNESAIEAIFAGDPPAIAAVRKELEGFKIKSTIDEQANGLFNLGVFAYPGLDGKADSKKISDLRYQAAVAFYSQSIELCPAFEIHNYGSNRLQLAQIKIDIRNDLRDYDGAKKLLREIIDRKSDGKQLCLPGHISKAQDMLSSIEKEQAGAAPAPHENKEELAANSAQSPVVVKDSLPKSLLDLLTKHETKQKNHVKKNDQKNKIESWQKTIDNPKASHQEVANAYYNLGEQYYIGIHEAGSGIKPNYVEAHRLLLLYLEKLKMLDMSTKFNKAKHLWARYIIIEMELLLCPEVGSFKTSSLYLEQILNDPNHHLIPRNLAFLQFSLANVKYYGTGEIKDIKGAKELYKKVISDRNVHKDLIAVAKENLTNIEAQEKAEAPAYAPAPAPQENKEELPANSAQSSVVVEAPVSAAAGAPQAVPSAKELSQAKFNLAINKYAGVVIEKDIPGAYKYFNEVLTENLVDEFCRHQAQLAIADIEYNKTGLDQKLGKARILYKIVSESAKGPIKAEATFKLAIMEYHAQGGDKKISEAKKHFIEVEKSNDISPEHRAQAREFLAKIAVDEQRAQGSKGSATAAALPLRGAKPQPEASAPAPVSSVAHIDPDTAERIRLEETLEDRKMLPSIRAAVEFHLAVREYEGKGFKADKNEAIKKLKLIIEGDMASSYLKARVASKIANITKSDKDGKNNIEIAKKLYIEAINNKGLRAIQHEQAHFGLGVLYFELEKNYAKARTHLNYILEHGTSAEYKKKATERLAQIAQAEKVAQDEASSIKVADLGSPLSPADAAPAPVIPDAVAADSIELPHGKFISRLKLDEALDAAVAELHSPMAAATGPIKPVDLGLPLSSAAAAEPAVDIAAPLSSSAPAPVDSVAASVISNDEEKENWGKKLVNYLYRIAQNKILVDYILHTLAQNKIADLKKEADLTKEAEAEFEAGQDIYKNVNGDLTKLTDAEWNLIQDIYSHAVDNEYLSDKSRSLARIEYARILRKDRSGNSSLRGAEYNLTRVINDPKAPADYIRDAKKALGKLYGSKKKQEASQASTSAPAKTESPEQSRSPSPNSSESNSVAPVQASSAPALTSASAPASASAAPASTSASVPASASAVVDGAKFDIEAFHWRIKDLTGNIRNKKLKHQDRSQASWELGHTLYFKREVPGKLSPQDLEKVKDCYAQAFIDQNLTPDQRSVARIELATIVSDAWDGHGENTAGYYLQMVMYDKTTSQTYRDRAEQKLHNIMKPAPRHEFKEGSVAPPPPADRSGDSVPRANVAPAQPFPLAIPDLEKIAEQHRIIADSATTPAQRANAHFELINMQVRGNGNIFEAINRLMSISQDEVYPLNARAHAKYLTAFYMRKYAHIGNFDFDRLNNSYGYALADINLHPFWRSRALMELFTVRYQSDNPLYKIGAMNILTSILADSNSPEMSKEFARERLQKIMTALPQL